MPVFKVDKNFKVSPNSEAIKLVPELSVLTSDEFEFVVLVADYVDGPYRKKPLEERILLAKKKVYGNAKKKCETPKVKNALVVYKSLVFDIRRETIDIFQKKIDILQRDTLNPDTGYNDMVKIDKTITFLTNRVESINKSLDLEELNNIEIKAGRQLSRIEIWQRNQKEFTKYNESK